MSTDSYWSKRVICCYAISENLCGHAPYRTVLVTENCNMASKLKIF